MVNKERKNHNESRSKKVQINNNKFDVLTSINKDEGMCKETNKLVDEKINKEDNNKVENVDEGYKDEGSLTSVEKEEVSAVLVEELKESTADTSPLKLEHLHSNKSLMEEGYVEVEITCEDILENVTEESEGIDVPADHCGNKELNDESVILNQGSFIERDKIEVLPNVELNMQSTKDNIRIDNIFSPTERSVHFMSNNKGVMSNDLSIQKENINYVTVQRKPSPNKELHALVSHDLNSMDKNLESVQTKEHI
ncbi:hypothetical protein K7X08_025708 [Anisodus acutangulus]|uniref:Uncharacterized protein n=1 Tax=Anisodus acutangulus TaxID=402998 RepID=A0A9Q1LAG2_9SOLA|nr:hypothetical protein K7X08_025708 [Anisodus acutangulus]